MALEPSIAEHISMAPALLRRGLVMSKHQTTGVKMSPYDDPITLALWAWWRYQLEPILLRLPEPEIMARANQQAATERLYRRLAC